MASAIFPLHACCLLFAISHLCEVNLASEHFRSQNPAQTRIPQIVPICRTVNQTKAPKNGGVGRMGGPYGHVPRAKIGLGSTRV